jgi:predicted ATPase
MTLRYVLTGAPGAGKTTLLRTLAGRGHDVVAEAATDVVATLLRDGVADPTRVPDFTARIAVLQRERRLAADRRGSAVTLYDRSPVCTLALARWLDHPVPAELREELAEIARDAVYQVPVFWVQPLGRIEATPVRRISYADSLRFADVHAEAYRELGFELIEVPALPVALRADLVEQALRGYWAAWPSWCW